MHMCLIQYLFIAFHNNYRFIGIEENTQMLSVILINLMTFVSFSQTASQKIIEASLKDEQSADTGINKDRPQSFASFSFSSSTQNNEDINVYRNSIREINRKFIDQYNSDPTKSYKLQYIEQFGKLKLEELQKLYLSLYPTSPTSIKYSKHLVSKKLSNAGDRLGGQEYLVEGKNFLGSTNPDDSKNNSEGSSSRSQFSIDQDQFETLKKQLVIQLKSYLKNEKKFSDAQINSKYLKEYKDVQISINETLNLTRRMLLQTNATAKIFQNSTLNTIDKSFNVDWTCISGRVKHQGHCGACYIFAVTDSVSAALAIYETSLYIRLSVQQILSCGMSFDNILMLGCRGGYLEGPFAYIKTYGVFSDFNYPYFEKTQNSQYTQKCRQVNKSFKKWSISDYIRIEKGNCTQLKLKLLHHPVAVAISFYKLQSFYYKKGVINDCDSTQVLDHAVLLVAYEAEKGWKIKNSWGTQWGQNGYAWISEKNNCNICQIAIYPVLRGKGKTNFDRNQILRKCSHVSQI